MDGEPERAAIAGAAVARVAADGREVTEDKVAVEAPIAFMYNCQSHAVMMATPKDLEDFAFGFSLSEGIVAGPEEIFSVRTEPKGPGSSLSIDIPVEREMALGSRKRNLEGRTGCGLCGVAEMEQALRPLLILPRTQTIKAAAITRAIAELPGQQILNQQTGAIHAAGFADRDGRLLYLREDVGRHNALDKLIGAAARNGVDPESGFVVVTSRCSMEMVQKTATFGCPILVAVSAPTSLAIEIADQCNLTIAAFARGTRFNLYAHPERIV